MKNSIFPDAIRLWWPAAGAAVLLTAGAVGVILLTAFNPRAADSSEPVRTLTAEDEALLDGLDHGTRASELDYIRGRKGVTVRMNDAEPVTLPPFRDDPLFLYDDRPGPESGMQSAWTRSKLGVHAEVFNARPELMGVFQQIAERDANVQERDAALTAAGSPPVCEEPNWKVQIEQAESDGERVLIFASASSGCRVGQSLTVRGSLTELWSALPDGSDLRLET